MARCSSVLCMAWDGYFSPTALGVIPFGFQSVAPTGTAGPHRGWHRVRLRINPVCQGEQAARGRKYPFPHPGMCLPQRAGLAGGTVGHGPAA